MFKDRAQVKALFGKRCKFDAVNGVTLYRDRREKMHIPDLILRDLGDGSVQVFVEIVSGDMQDIKKYLEA